MSATGSEVCLRLSKHVDQTLKLLKHIHIVKVIYLGGFRNRDSFSSFLETEQAYKPPQVTEIVSG